MVATVFRGDRSDRPYLILFAYHGMDFWRDGGCGLNDQILLPIGNIYCGLAADRTTTKRPSFEYHGIQNLRCGVYRPHDNGWDAKRSGQRKTTRTPHPSARDGSGIPILRMPIFNYAYGSMVTWCQ